MSPPGARRSVAYFPSRSGATPMERAFLFTRDVPLGIMPLRRARDRPEFVVTLDPPDAGVEEWLTRFLDVGQFTQTTLDEALVEFVESASRYLAYLGEVFFELLPPDEGDGPPTQLAPLPPGPVRHLPGRYLQIVPKADREAMEGRRYFAVPSDAMWHVRLPSSLGSPRQHRRMLRRLERLSGLMPDFAMRSTDLGQSESYDLSAHRKASELALERATNRWGTIPSLFQVKGTTEYFLFARRLQWHAAQAGLREHLIVELNALLSRLEVAHRLVVSGLPTAADISHAIALLKAGEIDVAEAMKLPKV